MAKPDTVIPFSKFVNITTSGGGSSFTFNRLNALIVTSPEIPMKKTVTVTSLEAVAKQYGTLREEYKYASEFFSYVSKNATKPEKLTFWNYYPEAQKASLVGVAIGMLNDIKARGILTLDINNVKHDINLDLENISSFTEVASIINSNLQVEEKKAIPYSLEGTSILNFTASATIDASEFIIQNEISETVFTYTASITFDTNDDIDSIVSKLNTTQLQDSNFLWNNNNNVLKLSQVTYSSASNTIPAQIFISDTEIKTKLGLDKIIVETGSPEIPAKNLGSCEYSTLTNSFIIKGDIASASKTIDFATGSLAEILGLSEKSGGYITQGSNSMGIADLMNAIGLDNGDYYTISVTNNVDIPESDYEKIGVWVKASNGRYCVVGYSNDKRLTTSNLVYENLFGYDGFIMIYGDSLMAAFMQAAIASVDFSTPNGMTNFNFIETSQFLDSAIGTSEELDSINANRVNCCYVMGGYGQSQAFFGEGKIFGSNFTNIANYIGNSWIKAKMEIAGTNIMLSQGFIALRGGSGKSMILASMQEVINLAKASGIIVTVGTNGLLVDEKNKIVSVTGNANAVNLIESNGYYIDVLPVTADDITKEQMRIQFIYTKNVPVNRLVVQSFVI